MDLLTCEQEGYDQIMRIEELWSRVDEAQLATFETAVAVDDLLCGLLAIEGAAASETDQVRLLTKGWARRVRLKAKAWASAPAAQASALGAVLGQDLGFAVDPREPVITLREALSQRSGPSVLIASLYHEVGLRAGFEIAVMELSGHFLVRVGRNEGVLLEIRSGKVLEAQDRRRIFKKETGRTTDAGSIARELPVGEVLAHVLKQMVDQHARLNELTGVFRAVSFACALRPDAAIVFLQRAAIAEKLGARAFADEIYRQVAQDHPGTQESIFAAAKLLEHRKPVLMQ